MEIRVHLNNLRTAPRKVRLVADLIRNKGVSDARSLLEFAVKKSTVPILKLLNSAVSSALRDFKLQESDLYVSKITVDEGPKLKRWHPMSRGRAYQIMKRTSHITLVLSEKSATKEPKATRATKETRNKKVPKVSEVTKTEKVRKNKK